MEHDFEQEMYLYQAEEKLHETIKSGADLAAPDDVAELSDDTMLVIRPVCICLQELPIRIYPAILSQKDAASQAYLPQMPVTVVTEEGTWCYEDADVVETLTDYLEAKMPLESVEYLKCRIFIGEAAE